MKRTITWLLLFGLYTFCYGQQTHTGTTIKEKLSPGDTLKAKHLNDLSWNALYTGKFDSATYYINQSLDIAQQLNYKIGIPSCYNTIATIYQYKGDLNNALVYYFKALRILTELNHKRGMSMVMGGIALNYYQQGKLPEALHYNFKALKIDEELKDSTMMATSISNIAMVYGDQKEFEKALTFYEKGLAIFNILRDTMRIAPTLEGIGVTYHDMKQYEKALKYLREGLFFAIRAGDVSAEASLYTNIGTVYLDIQQLDSALTHQLKALKIMEELGDEEGMIPCLANIGNIYDRQNKEALAVKYSLKANELAKKTGSLIYTKQTESQLSNIYQKQGNYKEAYEHHLKFIEARDSLYNEENTKKMLRTEMNYEYEKKAYAAKQEQLKKEAEAEATRKRQQIIIWTISGFLVLLAVIAFLVIRQFRYRNKEREMQLEQKLLRSQMNPHFIFNSLQAIQNFILQSNEKDAVKYLGSFASITRSVLENSRLELIPVRKEISLLESYLQLQKLRFGDKFTYTIKADDVVEADDILIPPMLAQPFIENALEHGMSHITEGGLITVDFFIQTENLIMEIKDNGHGIGQKNEYSNHTSLATTITRERIELMNSKSRFKIQFDITEAYPGQERKGVKVRFSIPLKLLGATGI